MAVTLGEAILYLRAKADDMYGTLDQAGRKTEGWASNLGGKIGPMLGGAIVGGLTAATGAVIGIGAAAWNVSEEIDAATKQIQGDFRLTADEAQRTADVGAQVWGNNFAESITEASNAAALVRQQMKGIRDDGDLQDATENAFRLRDAYQVDLSKGISSANTLMEEFGLTQQDAFDFLARGFQDGLDASGDFLDSVGEYSNQFSDAGFSAGDFFRIMESGQRGGVLGTDKIADAVKEMTIRLNEGGDATKAAFGSIGLDFDKVAESVRSGDEAWADYFDEIVAGINSIEDPILRSQMQVGIFGTMAEDLGVSFTEGLSTAGGAVEDFSGSIDAVDQRYGTLRQAATGYMRELQLALVPVGDWMLTVANDYAPEVQRALDGLTAGLTALFTGDFSNETIPEPFKIFQRELIGLRLRWKLDVDGMRTDAEEGWTGLTQAADDMWTSLDKIFGKGEQNIEGKEKTHKDNLIDTTIKWGTELLNQTTWFLNYLRESMEQVNRLMTGDWEGFWEGQKTIQQMEGEAMWSWVELRFGPEMTQKWRTQLGNIRSELQSWWDGVRTWWQGLSLSSIGMNFIRPNLVPGFATGTAFAPGGLALVGERGPELVNLPRGSQVFPNAEAMRALMGAGGNTTINIYDSGNPQATGQAIGSMLDKRRRRGY